MRISFRAFIAAAIAAGLVALRVQAQDTPAPATNSVSAPKTNVPAKAETKKAVTAKPAAKPAAKPVEPKPVVKTDPVLHSEPGVTKQNNVNIRGQASINS